MACRQMKVRTGGTAPLFKLSAALRIRGVGAVFLDGKIHTPPDRLQEIRTP